MEQSSAELFHPQIREAFTQWIEAIAKVLVANGWEATLARQRGEDAIISIQGALILCHSLRDFAPFKRIIRELPQKICRDSHL